MKKPDLLCIAHRGAMGHAPENTLNAIQKALDLGALCVEIDVYYVDKQLVVFHDERLERTTDGAGFLHEQSFEYLRTLDAGEGQQIPTLIEVCEVVDSKACLNIELKGVDTAAPVAELLLMLVNNGWRLESFLISSFHKQELLAIKHLLPAIKIGVLIDVLSVDDMSFAETLSAFSINPSLDHVTRDFIDDAHRRCLNVYVYTVDKTADVDRMYRLGADGVFTGFPERVVDNYSQTNLMKRWCDR